MDVRLPDGTLLRNVPEGTTKAQLTEKLAANGYDIGKLAPCLILIHTHLVIQAPRSALAMRSGTICSSFVDFGRS